MKHLTFKTIFLLALGSGKRRSEIRAWQNRNIRHQSDWSKVSLYPSPSFLIQESGGQRESRQCGPRGYNSPGPQLWIDPSSLTGPSVRSEHCATMWTGPPVSRRIRRWFLSPLRKISTKTSHLPLSPLGSSRL